MNRSILTASIVAALALHSIAAVPSPLNPADALAAFEYPDDLQIQLVASEPLVASPCAMAFDAKGRMFVAENRGYPSTAEPAMGVVALLEDTDGDGKMDKRTEFATGLTYPNGVLPWKDGVIVTCSPDVFFMRDTNGDGVADEKRVLFTGFATTGSTQLRVNAPRVGPDGWIYLAAGLSLGTITCPEHPERPALKMTGDVRFNPETLEIENLDGKSQFGQSFDPFGRRFICMNRLPVQQIVLPSKWLARNPNLAFSDTVQDCNERSVKTGLKGGGDGVRLFPISSNITTADSHQGSFSAACGITIWRDGALPDRYEGCALSCDPTGNLVHVDRLAPNGAAFSAAPLIKGHEFLASKDDWFRPVNLTRGPDGALYVADMYRKVIEHPDYLPEEIRKHTDFETGKNLGRIWKVTSKSPRKAPALAPFQDEFAPIRAAATDAALAQRLADDTSPRTRFCTALVLGDSKAEFAVPLLAQIAARDSADKWARAAVLSGIAGREGEFLQKVWPMLKGTTDGELELLSLLGRCFRDPAVFQSAITPLQASADTRLAALWVGFNERNPSAARASAEYAELLRFTSGKVADAAVSPTERLIFARLLGTGKWDTAGAPLQAAFQTSNDEALQSALIRSLTLLDSAQAATFLLADAAWPKYSPVLRETILNALFARGQLAGILDAVEAKRLPASALTSTRRQAFEKSKDTAIRDRAEKLFNAGIGDRAASLERAKAALALAPKSAHGREVFRQFCATCHRLSQEGVTVGPDLLDIRKQTKENIVFHIVMPEAEVAPAFTPYTCETKDGRAYAGILTSETPTSITIRQPGGIEETVLRPDLKSLTALPGTLMPMGLDAAMQPQDIADLVAFLKGEQ